jgi:hypothetical protein
VPVFNYEDLSEATEEGQVAEDIKTLIFINCGGLMSWVDHWSISHEADSKSADHLILILDSHRPYYHTNVHTQKSIIVIDDGDLPPITEIPDDEDLRLANEESDEEAAEENFDPNALEEGEEKRPRESDDLAMTRKKQRKEIAREYYESHSTGKSVAGLMFMLADQMNKASRDFFWLWVLGLTD